MIIRKIISSSSNRDPCPFRTEKANTQLSVITFKKNALSFWGKLYYQRRGMQSRLVTSQY